MYSAGGGEENFLTLPLQENYIPPTHRKNDTSLSFPTFRKSAKHRPSCHDNTESGFKRCFLAQTLAVLSINLIDPETAKL